MQRLHGGAAEARGRGDHPGVYDWPLAGWSRDRAGLLLLDWMHGSVDDVASLWTAPELDRRGSARSRSIGRSGGSAISTGVQRRDLAWGAGRVTRAACGRDRRRWSRRGDSCRRRRGSSAATLRTGSCSRWTDPGVHEGPFFADRRCSSQALDALGTAISRKKVNWVLEVAIRGSFDAIDHGWLMRFVEHRNRGQEDPWRSRARPDRQLSAK